VNRIIRPKEICGIIGHICFVIIDRYGRKRFYTTHNVVTNYGDEYYAQRANSETPTYDLEAGGLKLGNSVTTPTKSDTDVTAYLTATYKALRSGYPTTNDSDVDNVYNGNVDYITWSYLYGSAEAVYSDIKEGAIVDQESSPNVALCHFLFASTIDKKSGESLKVFVNHEFLGV
jgi:hypothetical protein